MSLERNDYRGLRRAFIAACEAARIDAIARLHPARGPDGGLLFMDCAALGPRLASRAVLVLTNDAAGSGLVTALLRDRVRPPGGARLVLVHALDPAALAGVDGEPGWPDAMLRAVAAEDLSKVTRLTVLDLTGRGLEAALAAAMPAAIIQITELSSSDAAQAVRDALAAI
ncbi:MAG TPA: DUF2817 domain-containing protein [Rhizomicrobium sp.]